MLSNKEKSSGMTLCLKFSHIFNNIQFNQVWLCVCVFVCKWKSSEMICQKTVFGCPRIGLGVDRVKNQSQKQWGYNSYSDFPMTLKVFC